MALASDREQAVEAMQAWYRHHRRVPTRDEWDGSPENRPTSKTIQRRWGWQAMWAEIAGIEPSQLRERRDDRKREDIVRTLRSWTERRGHLPTADDWELADDEHPSRRTVVRLFGSWVTALSQAFPPETLAALEEQRLQERRQQTAAPRPKRRFRT
jgi:hypothetical protein